MPRTKKHKPGGGTRFYNIDNRAKKRRKLAKKSEKAANKNLQEAKDKGEANFIKSEEQEEVMADTLTGLSGDAGQNVGIQKEKNSVVSMSQQHQSNFIIGNGDHQKPEPGENSKITAFQKYQEKKGPGGLAPSKSVTTKISSITPNAKNSLPVPDIEAKLLGPVFKNDVHMDQDGDSMEFEEWNGFPEDEEEALETKDLSLDSTSITDSTMKSPSLSDSDHELDHYSAHLKFLDVDPRFPSSAPLGFPRILDVNTWSRELETEEYFHIADAVVTLLYKKDVRLLDKFLEYEKEPEFSIRTIETGCSQPLHVYRNDRLVMVAYMGQDCIYDPAAYFEVLASGEWKPDHVVDCMSRYYGRPKHVIEWGSIVARSIINFKKWNAKFEGDYKENEDNEDNEDISDEDDTSI